MTQSIIGSEASPQRQPAHPAARQRMTVSPAWQASRDTVPGGGVTGSRQAGKEEGLPYVESGSSQTPAASDSPLSPLAAGTGLLPAPSPFVMMGSLGKAHSLTVGVSFLPSGDPKPGSRKVHGSTRGRLWRASLPGLKGFSI